MKTVRVAVTGAAGQIGYALVFRIASGEMFGPETGIDLRLVEVPDAVPAARGVAMELEDSAFPCLKRVLVTDSPAQGFEGADWALLIGSAPRQAGMERGDLLRVNGGIFVEQGRALDQIAGDDCKVLVVGNPCNTNALIAKSVCRRIPARNFFAMTMLDQTRAAHQLAVKAGVAVDAVSHIAVWGNHSATQYPDFYNARIHGLFALDVIGDEEWLRTDFLEAVQRRGAAVLEARGRSSAASAAQAVIRTVQALTRPSRGDQFFSVAVCSDGSYGIEEGLIFSFPVLSDGRSWRIIQGLELNAFSRARIAQTAEELRKEKSLLGNILG